MSYNFSTTSTDEIACGTGVTNGSSRTIAMWVNLNNAGSGGEKMFAHFSNTILSRETMYFQITVAASNTIGFGMQRSTSSYVTATWASGFGTGEWHFVCGRYDGSNLEIYADGDTTPKVQLAETGTPITITGTPKFTIGNDADGGRPADAKIAEVAWYTSALSVGEITMLGKGLSPLSLPTKPTAYWPLVRGTNDIVANNNGTATGATADVHPSIYKPFVYQVPVTAGGGGGGTAVPVFFNHYRKLHLA